MSKIFLVSPWLQSVSSTFITTLTGLAFETLPFLLIGTFLSSIIHVFVPDRIIRRVFPKNRILSILVALVIGVFIPICECGTVPLARRLRDKGLPLSTATAFLLAAPLVNPMTILSTYTAFNDGPYPMFLFRVLLGLATAFGISLIVEVLTRRDPLVTESPLWVRYSPIAVGSIRVLRLSLPRRKPAKSFFVRIGEMLEHTSRDFLDSGRYLIAGISVAALVRSFLPSDILMRSLQHPMSAIGTGTASAYLLSLCSEADAFVARSIFIPGSYPAALAFLILGPMIDLKNSILLARYITKRQLAVFILLIFAFTATIVFLASPLFGAKL